MKWLLLIVAAVAIFIASKMSKARKNQMAIISTMVGLVCMIGFFLFQFGVFDSRGVDPNTTENSALAYGLANIMKKNNINRMEEIPFFSMEKDEVVEATVKSLIAFGYADFTANSAADYEYEDLDSFLYDYNFAEERAPVVVIKGNFTADPVADYRGQIIVIGERPAGLNNVLAVITPNGTEEALSKNPQKAFKEMYTVEE